MSQYTSDYPPPVSSSNDPSTSAVAREQTTEVGRTAGAAGQRVAGTAAEQAGQVTQEARRQAKDLYQQARGQVTQQARQGQQQAGDGLRTLASELHEMADSGQQQGPASDLAKQAADKLGDLADWLGRREPGDLVEEVRTLARRRPGAFLLGAAAAGILVGRLTRGAVDANRQDTQRNDYGRDLSGRHGLAEPAWTAPAQPPVMPANPPYDHLGAPPVPQPYPSHGESALPPQPYPTQGEAAYPTSGEVRPPVYGEEVPPTPPEGNRTVGEYVDDLQSRGEGRPEAGGTR